MKSPKVRRAELVVVTCRMDRVVLHILWFILLSRWL